MYSSSSSRAGGYSDVLGEYACKMQEIWQCVHMYHTWMAKIDNFRLCLHDVQQATQRRQSLQELTSRLTSLLQAEHLVATPQAIHLRQDPPRLLPADTRLPIHLHLGPVHRTLREQAHHLTPLRTSHRRHTLLHINLLQDNLL